MVKSNPIPSLGLNFVCIHNLFIIEDRARYTKAESDANATDHRAIHQWGRFERISGQMIHTSMSSIVALENALITVGDDDDNVNYNTKDHDERGTI